MTWTLVAIAVLLGALSTIVRLVGRWRARVAALPDAAARAAAEAEAAAAAAAAKPPPTLASVEAQLEALRHEVASLAVAGDNTPAGHAVDTGSDAAPAGERDGTADGPAGSEYEKR